MTGLLRFTLHLPACRLHYTFESEVRNARNDAHLKVKWKTLAMTQSKTTLYTSFLNYPKKF